MYASAVFMHFLFLPFCVVMILRKTPCERMKQQEEEVLELLTISTIPGRRYDAGLCCIKISEM